MPKKGRTPSAPNSGLRVRKARASDADALVALEERIFASDRMSRRSFAAATKRPSAAMLVACRGAEIVGYALLFTRRGIVSARLYSLAVAPEAAGQGVGRRLVSAIESEARRRGAAQIRLEVRVDNGNAIRFYEDMGYAPFGRRDAYYSDGVSALRYARDLKRATRRRVRRRSWAA